MSQPADVERRLAALEARMDVAAADATAARHLAAARDRDLADLGVKVDANRTVINAMGQQLSGRIDELSERMDARFEQVDARFQAMDVRFAQVDANFEQVDANFEQVDANFLTVRGQLDAAAAGQQRIVELLTTLNDGSPSS